MTYAVNIKNSGNVSGNDCNIKFAIFALNILKTIINMLFF
jgi:hypothetical protein